MKELKIYNQKDHSEIKKDNQVCNYLNILKYTSLLIPIGIIYGYLYNLFLYNILLDFDIFLYLDSTDLIFSWIANKHFLSMATIFLFFALTAIYIDNIKDDKKRLFIFRVLLSLMILGIAILINKSSLYFDFNNFFSFATLFTTVFIVFFIYFIFKFKDKPKYKSVTIKKISIIIIFNLCLYIFAAVFISYNNITDLNRQKKFYKITLKKTINSENINYSKLLMIGRTNTNTIFYAFNKKFDDKTIIVINNSNISSIEYINKY